YSLLGLVIVSLLNTSVIGAEDASPEHAVKAAKDVLSRGGRFPWYDRGKDDVRRLNMTPRENAHERDVTWADTTVKPTSQPRRWPRLNLFGDFLSWAGITLLIIFLGLIA